MSRWRNRLLGALDWRAHAVLRRNAKVFFRNWRTALIPPAFEPIIFFLAFGLGLGSHVASMGFGAETYSYASWVAPGLLAYSAFGTPFFEGLYAAYIRMFYQKTWDGILATQVELEHIIWGEILWTGVRGAVNGVLVSCVLAIFDALDLISIRTTFLVFVPFITALVGCVFGAFALVFTAIVPSIDHMNYPTFLVGIPLGLVSNTYFAVDASEPALAFLVAINPLAHLADTLRGLLLAGQLTLSALYLALTALVYLFVFSTLVQVLMRRRLLR